MSKQQQRKRIREQEEKLADLLFAKASVPVASDESESTEQDQLQSWSDLHEFTDDQTKPAVSSAGAVWVDEEEENLEVDLNATARLRKLKRYVDDRENGNGNGKVSGKTFSKLLKQRALLQNEHLNVDWDHIRKLKSKGLDKDEDEQDLFASAMSFRDDDQRSSALVGSLKKLSTAKIDISRVMDANAQDPSREKITAVNFHSSGNLLLTGGLDKVLRFFKIDGEKNEKQLSVRFNDMAILSAQFVPNSSEVILGGRTPYFYSYNVETGNVQKFNHNSTYRMNFQFDDNNNNSSSREEVIRSHEHMICSSGGDKIAIMSGSGYSHILDSRSKAIVTSTKINCPLRSHCFGFDDTTYITSGVDAEVYIWDIRKTSRCVLKFKHEDGLCTSALAATNAATTLGGSNQIAVGSESGVVTLFESSLQASTRRPTAVIAKQPSIMSLTTPVTLSKFHPSGQLLAIASNHKTDQLTLVHAGTTSVFQNWPTDRTPLGKVQCVDFSSGGGFMAIGNHKGNVLLYRLNHFLNA